jgi:hypothetical protein
VLTISGVEIDYDAEEVPFDSALQSIKTAGLIAIVYTSPSHTSAAPRWRVLAPTSTDLRPESRAQLVARVNGVLGGIAAPESFVLSQSFYFGSVNGNEEHRAEIVEGDFIDLRDDLDIGAIGRAQRDTSSHDRGKYDPEGDGVDPQFDIEEAREGLELIDPDIGRHDWFAIGCALYKQFGDDGLDLWDEWSSKGSKYNAREMDGQRASIARGDGYGYTIGTLIHFANEVRPAWRSTLSPEKQALYDYANSAENVARFMAEFAAQKTATDAPTADASPLPSAQTSPASETEDPPAPADAQAPSAAPEPETPEPEALNGQGPAPMAASSQPQLVATTGDGKAENQHLVLQLGTALWGPWRKTTTSEYRFGANGSKTVTLRGSWFDFEKNDGGSITDLMQMVAARGKAAAIDPEQRLLLSSAAFVGGFTPPEYLIDGLLQRRFVYSLTAPTGNGKTAVALRIAAHVAVGSPIAGQDVEKGRVAFFAGENPDDVSPRWIKLCEEMDLDPATLEVYFMAGAHPIATDTVREMIDAEVAAIGPISLLIVDTSAAYFTGDDENDNVQLGAHARMLRSFTNLPGGPTVIVTCHPTKNPDPSNLLPRGGGAFLAEVDGNLVVIREKGSKLIEVDTHGKFRGPEFAPFRFKLVEATSEKLKDGKGRSIWTVFAEPVGEAEREAIEAAGERNRNALLCVMKNGPARSIAELAVALGWEYRNGDPNRSLVQRVLGQLKSEKLVEMKGKRYRLTKKGQEAVKELEDAPM